MDLTTRILNKWRARRNADLTRVKSSERLRDNLKLTAWERLFLVRTVKGVA